MRERASLVWVRACLKAVGRSPSRINNRTVLYSGPVVYGFPPLPRFRSARGGAEGQARRAAPTVPNPIKANDARGVPAS